MVTHGVQVVIFWGTGIPLHFVFWVGPLDLGDFYGYLIRKIGTSRSKLVIPTYHSIAIYQFITHYSIICSLCLDPCDENLRDSQAYSPIKPTYTIKVSNGGDLPKPRPLHSKPHMASETQPTLSHLRSVSDMCFCVSNQFHMFAHPL